MPDGDQAASGGTEDTCILVTWEESVNTQGEGQLQLPLNVYCTVSHQGMFCTLLKCPSKSSDLISLLTSEHSKKPPSVLWKAAKEDSYNKEASF